MGAFGSISAMITSLKNNKIKKRDFHDSFRDVNWVSQNKQPLKFKNKLSEKEFNEFSKKLVEKKRRSTIILSLTYGFCVIFIFVIVFGFL